ncbi:MAG: CapA family protein, partial [Chloroflexota bacterium]|nr:CapA family protein [Chloroflexota bacterium]
SSRPAPSERPTPSEQPPPSDEAPAPEVELAFVPVVGFWSPETSISLRALEDALSGTSRRHPSVIVPEEDRDALVAALGIVLGPDVESGNRAQIARAVSRGALGLLRVTDVTPAVRALAVEGVSVFGNGRTADLGDWPLKASVAPEKGLHWDQASTWTLVAGGDIQLDRWMAYHVTTLDKGVDWPYDGGAVRITGRVCCSALGHRLPEWQPSGNEGAVRALFAEADLAMANLEAAAIDDPSFHRLGRNFRFSLNFSGDPRLLEGLDNAGFDFLSLANNHIDNAGPAGIRDTRTAHDELDIAHAGAGRHLRQASRPAFLEAADQTVAMLPCTTVGRVASPAGAGAAPCAGPGLVRRIRQAAEDSDVVIVFPHWGREYRATPSAAQRRLAQSWVDAGADLVLGAHSHWTGAIEEIDESLIFYSMGNLAFDQPWSEPTMQGVILELTFHAERLAQVRLHPTLIVDDVQPNLLDYDAGGERVFRRMREASDGLLPY